MTENTGSAFEPLSDEQLARVLEDQMRALRGEAPIGAPATEPVVMDVSAPIFEPAVDEIPAVIDEEEEDEGIAALFGALLEDTSEFEQVPEPVATTEVSASVNYDDLDHTQPITYLAEEVVSSAVIDEHVVVEDTVVEEVFSEPVVFDNVVVEDAHLIAARVISEISIDGEVVATTIAATAGSEPIPSMFGDFAEAIPAAEVATEASAESSVNVSAPGAEFVPESVVVPDSAASMPPVQEADEAEIGETTTVSPPLPSAPILRSSSPVSSFAPRPSFDELVFGGSAED